MLSLHTYKSPVGLHPQYARTPSRLASSIRQVRCGQRKLSPTASDKGRCWFLPSSGWVLLSQTRDTAGSYRVLGGSY